MKFFMQICSDSIDYLSILINDEEIQKLYKPILDLMDVVIKK